MGRNTNMKSFYKLLADLNLIKIKNCLDSRIKMSFYLLNYGHSALAFGLCVQSFMKISLKLY